MIKYIRYHRIIGSVSLFSYLKSDLGEKHYIRSTLPKEEVNIKRCLCFPSIIQGRVRFMELSIRQKKRPPVSKTVLLPKYLNFTFVLWWMLGPVIWEEEILRNWCGNISAHFGGWRRKIGGWGRVVVEGGCLVLWLPPSSMASLPPSTPTYTNT